MNSKSQILQGQGPKQGRSSIYLPTEHPPTELPFWVGVVVRRTVAVGILDRRFLQNPCFSFRRHDSPVFLSCLTPLKLCRTPGSKWEVKAQNWTWPSLPTMMRILPACKQRRRSLLLFTTTTTTTANKKRRRRFRL